MSNGLYVDEAIREIRTRILGSRNKPTCVDFKEAKTIAAKYHKAVLDIIKDVTLSQYYEYLERIEQKPKITKAFLPNVSSPWVYFAGEGYYFAEISHAECYPLECFCRANKTTLYLEPLSNWRFRASVHPD